MLLSMQHHSIIKSVTSDTQNHSSLCHLFSQQSSKAWVGSILAFQRWVQAQMILTNWFLLLVGFPALQR